ncbi:Protein ZINC INDUCED FACILITATOR-LIKE 1 [Glycine max]|nr:Protein ZINC INDUCED FACILITATOR-LIKE 1 [Glycine max]
MGEENVKQPLLERKYYKDCPGCKVDQAKELSEGKGVPVKNLFIMWMVVLCAALPISSLFPFLYFMVRDFNIAKTEADISSYAGYVGSSFMLGRCLTSVLWGIVADRYGRKPVIVMGIIAVVIFNTLFGLSTNFWMAVIMRFLLGSLNGLLGPVKAYASELFREEHQAIGLSTVSAAWGIGLIIGPALGGYLAQPVEKYPHIFTKDSFWDKFPYFLPNLIISAFAFVVAIGCIWIPETLHNHNCSNESTDDAKALESGNSGAGNEKIIQKNDNLLLNWPLMSSIIVYCVFSLHDIAYQEVFSLWAVSPQRLGGLNFTTDNVGDVLSISGLALIIYQLTLYPFVEKASGPIVIARFSGMLTIPLLQSYPFIALLSGLALYIVISIASILKNIMSITIITSLFLLQNRAVEQHQRGAANGISMTAMSLFKAIGPATGGAVLTWSQKRMDASFLPGTHMVFFVLNIVEALGILMMFKPFLVEKKKTHSDQQPLLEKKYYEDCPGCKVDQAKELSKGQGVSIRNLLIIWMVVLCSALPISSLFPFLYFMVRDFNIAKTEADISSYAGYVGSSYMLGRCLTSVLWGIVADRYGRKPVIVIGIISVVLFNTLFGLSTSFWMAFIMRFLLGSFHGLLGTVKAYATELFREEHQALGLSTVSAVWGIGLIIGPALGGYLAQPAEKYPDIFPKDSFWDKFPYFLPCFIISAAAFVVAIGCIWIPETLHNHNSNNESIDNSEALENGSSGASNEKTIQKNENLLRNWPLMSSILSYCVFSLHDIAYQEVFSLWSVSPQRLGGLNFTTNDVGNVLSISGLALITYQLTIYQSVEKASGPISIARISAMLSIPLLQSYPFIALLSGLALYIVLSIASILKNILSITIVTGLFILQNRAVEQHQRGAANGIAMTGMSLFKAIGPAAGGALLTWSEKRMDASFLPGTHMVFFALNIVEGFGLLMLFKPFLVEKMKTHSDELH